MRIERPEEVVIKNEPCWDAISSAVYIGGVTDLVKAEFLEWRIAGEEELPHEELTLAEIAEQCKAAFCWEDCSERVITVFVEEVGEGRIYQLGYNADACWLEYGKTAGKA